MSVSGTILLLGDSIFDNGAYTRGEPDVLTHLRNVLPASWRADSRAVDGATIAGLAAQIVRVPDDVSHIVVAIGGNDALRNADLLSLGVRSSAEALRIFAERADTFERAYGEALRRVQLLARPVTVCTIYNGALPPAEARIARVALAVFNDAILRTASRLGVDIIELRHVCSEPADYANPIEPSGSGGKKIAEAIARAIGAVSNTSKPSVLWGRYGT